MKYFGFMHSIAPDLDKLKKEHSIESKNDDFEMEEELNQNYDHIVLKDFIYNDLLNRKDPL